VTAATAGQHLWRDEKTYRAAQRRREHRRRGKPESRREYRVRRSAGGTIRLTWNGMPGERK